MAASKGFSRSPGNGSASGGRGSTMLRGITSGPRKVVRGGQEATAKAIISLVNPGVSGIQTSGTAQAEAPKDGDVTARASKTVSSFLDLPFEIRLEIYEHLLLAPNPIVITPKRRQVYPPNHDEEQANERRPYVKVLCTCKQINAEGTRLLYGKNRFLVGQFQMGVPVCLNARREMDMVYRAPNFFLWGIRTSTIALITDVSFAIGCGCHMWVTRGNKCYKTTGRALLRQPFIPSTFPDYLSLSPKLCRELFAFIHNQIFLLSRLSAGGVELSGRWP